MRFAGVKNNKIFVVSDKQINNSNYEVIKIDDHLDSVKDVDLITNYKVFENKIVPQKSQKPLSELKFAFVGNWRMKCGISTYSENLLPHIVKEFKHFKLFIEENDSPTHDVFQVGEYTLDKDQVSTCWKRGESLKKLVDEIKKYNPDVILIQHEFGLWHNARYWLSFMNQISEFKTFVTMHSVFYHKDKTICEAAMPNIIVHLDGAKKVLKEDKGVPGNVFVIPHGFNKATKEKLWNFYKSDKTFMQFGFGFRYKGWENCIKATAILKEKYKDVFFTGLFSESPFNKLDHELYYNDLMALISSLGLEENVALIRGYQSNETLDAYLRTNQACVFPYGSHPEHEVFGASGAARMAMAAGTSTITTSIHHFADIPSIKVDTEEDMANALSSIFESNEKKQKQIDVQFEFALNNSWEKCAEKYLDLFKS